MKNFPEETMLVAMFIFIVLYLLIKVLGEADGSHSRSVIGVNSLPKESPIEIDGIFGILD